MSTLLAGILIIGGTGVVVCGSLYLLFKILDKIRNNKWQPILTKDEELHHHRDDFYIPPQSPIVEKDNLYTTTKIGTSIGEWNN